VNFGTVFRAFDALVALRDAAQRFKLPPPGARPPETALGPPAAIQGLAGQLEARLTNVVVAALKEAFDRDHARMELERAQLEEQRRRAEEALRLELARQHADRELGRLRLLASVAMVGWIASILILGWRLPLASGAARAALGGGWLSLLIALGLVFQQMGRVAREAREPGAGLSAAATALPTWLLMLGLALSAASLLL
jgi:hypothetical protein